MANGAVVLYRLSVMQTVVQANWHIARALKLHTLALMPGCHLPMQARHKLRRECVDLVMCCVSTSSTARSQIKHTSVQTENYEA